MALQQIKSTTPWLRWLLPPAVVAVGLLLWIFNPTSTPLAPRCLFRALTGWSCPACGIQRALHAALHGNFLEAISYNYYLLYALPYALLICIVWYLPEGERKRKWQAVVEHPWAIWILIISMLAWMIIRNILGI